MIEVTWEYYNSHFPKLAEDQFNKLIYKAQRIVTKKLIKKDLTEDETTDVKDCICNVLNYLQVAESHTGVTSASNDGYSESYENTATFNDSINSIINEWIGYLIVSYIGF
ncbi:hypothetical protein ACWG0P_07115 [Amedibacillus sp. YH-ame6]